MCCEAGCLYSSVCLFTIDQLLEHQLFSLYAGMHTVKQELSSFMYDYNQWVMMMIIIIIIIIIITPPPLLTCRGQGRGAQGVREERPLLERQVWRISERVIVVQTDLELYKSQYEIWNISVKVHHIRLIYRSHIMKNRFSLVSTYISWSSLSLQPHWYHGAPTGCSDSAPVVT